MTEMQTCPACGGVLPSDAPEGLCPRCLLHGALSDTPPSFAADKPVATSPYAGGSWVAPTPAELAAHFPQLEILQLLGQGGMGAVYKARQVKLDRLVALKVLPPEIGRDSAFAERFAREARALARLNHPGIVGIHDYGKAGDYFYLLMEFVDGDNLRSSLRSRRLPVHEAQEIITQACDALQFAHDEGIVHRDVKPENLLLDRRGRVKIADFGLAKLVRRTPADLHLTATHQVMGTPHYIAPEQMEQPQSVDHRADVYSLGVVFYELLTGELPLGRFAPPSQRAQVEPRLDPIVLRCLEKEPERRYQRIGDLKADLEWMQRLQATVGAPAVVPAAAMQGLDVEMQRLQVKGPAAGLMLTGLLTLLGGLGGATAGILSTLGRQQDFDLAFRIIYALAPVVLLAVGILVFAARRLMNFERYEFVVFAAIFAMLPFSPVFLIGFPVGVWTLVTLWRPNVKKAFVQRELQMRQAGPNGRKGSVGSFFQAAQSLVFGSRIQGSAAGLSAPVGESTSHESRANPILIVACVALLLMLGATLWLTFSGCTPTTETKMTAPASGDTRAAKSAAPASATKSDVGATKK